MKKKIVSALAGLVSIFALPAAADEGPFEITATGVGPTGFLKVIIEAYHDVYRDQYPGTSATFIPGTITGGMVQAAAGEVDIAVGVTPVELIYGLTGHEPFTEPLDGKVQQVFTMFANLEFWFIADKGWADANGITSLADIAEKKPAMRLAIGALSTPYINDTANAIFQQHGFSLDDVAAWGGVINTYPSGRGIDDIRDGKVDVQVIAALHPDSRLIDLNRTRPLVWLDVDPQAIATVAPDVDMSPSVMPAEYYEFLSEDKHTIRASASLMAGTHVPEDVVYKIARSIGENMERVRGIHPALAEFSPEVMVLKSPRVPYHPGAERYYREKGWIQ